MSQITLTDPVGLMMRASDTIAVEDSLLTAAEKLHECPLGVLPVTEGGEFVGAITEESLAKSLTDSLEMTRPAGDAASAYPTIEPYATGAEALRVMVAGKNRALVVVDDRGHVVGLLGSSDLVRKDREILTPPMVGGMATPFGVYLTSGSTGAGARGLALVATGMMLFAFYLTGQILSVKLENHFGTSIPEFMRPAVFALTPLVFFLALMRILPISGTHGAEHQVVHAIERGEPLIPEIIRRMPRVHPRCGTNLAVAAMLFLSVMRWNFTSNDEIRFMVAILVTVFAWRPIGNFLQQYVTTRVPTDRQLESGIHAAHELIEEHAQCPVATPSVAARLWNSGAFHVMIGSTICFFLFWGAQVLFGIDLGVDLWT